jgi:hypothetical protein
VALTEDVKVALRITSDVFDDEIDALLEAAKDDLKLSGVSAAAIEAGTVDALIKRALVLYCKAEFGLDNADSEKYAASYRLIVSRLALSSEYAQPKMDGLSGTIAAGSDELTVDDATNLAEDDWLSIGGAGASGAILIAQVSSVDGDVVTLSRVAATAVTDATVTLL